jgi:hypothetical protein
VTGQPGQDSQERLAGTGQPGQVSLDRTAWTGKLNQVSLDMSEQMAGTFTTGTGQPR